jgi:hypothetical protein
VDGVLQGYTTDCNFTALGMQPSTQYTINVTPYNENGDGVSESVTLSTVAVGESLPLVAQTATVGLLEAVTMGASRVVPSGVFILSVLLGLLLIVRLIYSFLR